MQVGEAAAKGLHSQQRARVLFNERMEVQERKYAQALNGYSTGRSRILWIRIRHIRYTQVLHVSIDLSRLSLFPLSRFSLSVRVQCARESASFRVASLFSIGDSPESKVDLALNWISRSF